MKRTIRIGLLAIACALPVGGQALTLQKVADLNFEKIRYSLPLNGAVSMGTNGSIAYGTAFSGTGNGVAGQVEIQETNGTVVEVSCSDGKIAHSTGAVLDLTTTAVVGAANVAGWGSTTNCTGVGNTILTHTVGVGTPLNTVYIGAEMTPTSVLDGAYNTSETGGQQIQLRVVVQ